MDCKLHHEDQDGAGIGKEWLGEQERLEKEGLGHIRKILNAILKFKAKRF